MPLIKSSSKQAVQENTEREIAAGKPALSSEKNAKARLACIRWNERHPVGTPVDLRRDNGTVERTRTRSTAYVCEAGYPVIFLDGVRGYYLLDRVTEAT